jgi:hypothetical protein
MRLLLLIILIAAPGLWAEESTGVLELGLSQRDFQDGKLPAGWNLKWFFGRSRKGTYEWVEEDGFKAVKMQSDASLIFLARRIAIDLKEYPFVSWKWKVENVLEGNDESTVAGDDHPIRIFFVFQPDASKQSVWFRIKRFFWLDIVHGHPMGGMFTEYLWSRNRRPGDIIRDPANPRQKLMVIEGGKEKLGTWISYERNLYEDFKNLYDEEPRRLIFIGILNDTDQTGQKATSFITDLIFRRSD